MEDNFLIPIGKRMAEIRRSHNITQETLAEKLGVTPKHISCVECGISSLSLKNLIEFSNVLDCSLDYILLGEKKDNALSKLPKEIIDVLYSGDEKEIDRLNRYLELYIEMSKEQS